jgi:hypothetical protein
MDVDKFDIQYFPLDFDALKKGDEIEADRLESITNTKRGTDQYNLAVLALRARIMQELKDRGKFVTVAVVKGCLRLLTDEQAALYNARMYRAGFQRAGRSLKRLAKVDVGNLTDQQKQDHERTLLVFGKMLQAAKTARREIAATPYQRTLPGIPHQTK